ncbi:hypothetical protein QTO34_001721 [Cnephaeus nilssonii]|uniref:DNA endonuclease Ctp1 N-terminal domain-containing protein n=1 Tax=Cnephaeus nilssonii TaxID=3371016 RepID=A0AA40HTK1_CNENI|nr:hypothetical protein QTO34_001721 [Eptesicus nilssonii]
MESFMESLNRLKDIHERRSWDLAFQAQRQQCLRAQSISVARCPASDQHPKCALQGFSHRPAEQASRTELRALPFCSTAGGKRETPPRWFPTPHRDAQRVEELCAKNHQLREQQKALKDNVRVLENRQGHIPGGSQPFGDLNLPPQSGLLPPPRHRLRAGLCDRCTVTQELARKKQQELESSLLQNLQHLFILTNEVTRLQEENETLKEEVAQLRRLGPKPQCREGSSDPSSPPLLISPGPWKASTEKLPGGHEEAEDHPPDAGPRGEEKLGHRMSPVAKISPGANLPEPRASDMSPQHISNQLHGTIAVVRPGAWACSTDRGSANGTPSAQSSPPSLPYEHSLSLDSFLRASRASARPYESLKHALQADRLCLLNRPLSLHLRSPQSSPRAPAAAPDGPQPQTLKAGEAEAWEAPSGLLGLPGTLVDMQDPRLEGALSLLLAQQLRARGQAGGARMRGPPRPGETLPSPPIGSDSDGSESEVPRGQHRQPAGPGSPRGKEATAAEDLVPDKPLDLSEWGRGQDAPKPVGRPGRFSPQTAHTPSPEPPQGAKPLAQSGPWGRSNGTKGARAPGPEEASMPEFPHLQSCCHSSWSGRLERALLPPDSRAASSRLTPALHPAELSKAQAQRPLSDKLDEPDASDSEVGLSPEAGATSSTPGAGPRCFCTKEPGQGPPQKRKWAQASDLWDKASKKLS